VEYLNPLIREFNAAANPFKAAQMQKYMKGKFVFFGIQNKQRLEIQKQFFKEFGWPEKRDLFKIVFYLWGLQEREFHMCAINILQKFEKKFENGDILNIEKLIVTNSWWDTVDGLSAWICGAYFRLFPDQIKEYTGRWVISDNFWLQRSALLFQLKYKKQTNTELLGSYIVKLSDSKEFFIRKAIGWVLREYSKVNPDWIREFVSHNKLSTLSYREATKYI
jgi:3-methyladenine DNA glycosylase AlkD